MIDTLVLARRRHPGAKHSLDALCTRYGVDRSHRVLHGALLDAELLAQVYVELTGGRQIGLALAAEIGSDEPSSAEAGAASAKTSAVANASGATTAARRRKCRPRRAEAPAVSASVVVESG